MSSSPGRQAKLSDYFSPRRRAAERMRLEAIEDSPVAAEKPAESQVEALDLSGSPTPKARRTSPRQLSNLDARKRFTPPPTQEDLRSNNAILSPNVPRLRMPPPLTATTKLDVESIDLSASSPVAQSVLRTRTVVTQIQKKQVYRVRDSLPGSFAIEELDLTGDVGQVKEKQGKRFRMSGVGVLDLTGD